MEKEQSYQVNEIFRSIQGEGFWCGTQAVFVRLQGCPVGCEWCDTRRTWGRGGTSMTISEIVGEITRLNIGQFGHVVITGGEPTIWELGPLVDALHFRPYYVQLETSALEGGKDISRRPNWITVSPKAQLDFRIRESFRRHNGVNEVKYVVDDSFDEAVVDESLHAPIYLMPEGLPSRVEMIHKTLEILERHPAWRFGSRLQGWINIR